MEGILIHSTTFDNLEYILEDGYLYDSSKTEPEFGDGDDYTELLKNKIFFQLVFKGIKLTGDYKLDKGVSNPVFMFFDSKMLEDYGYKRYTKSEKEKKLLNKMNPSKKAQYLENEIPKYKVWFNPQWLHGGFHKINRNGLAQSVNYDPYLSVRKNIKNFYKAKVKYIKDHKDEDLEEYEEMLEYYENNEEKIPKEEEEWWKEHFKTGMPKTFTNKAKNEVVFQAKKIPVTNIIAIYSYFPQRKIYIRLQEEYPDIKFLNSPEELKKFMVKYYK
jgi:hypothetical protein